MARNSVHADNQTQLQVLFEGTLAGLSDRALLDRLTTTGDRAAAAAFAGAGGASRAHGASRLPAGARESPRRRGCFPGHLPGPLSPGRGHQELCFAGELALRGCPPGGMSVAKTGPAPPGPRTTTCGCTWPRIARVREPIGDLAGNPRRSRRTAGEAAITDRPLLPGGTDRRGSRLATWLSPGDSLIPVLVARERLRDRLSRRGLGLPAGLPRPG